MPAWIQDRLIHASTASTSPIGRGTPRVAITSVKIASSQTSNALGSTIAPDATAALDS
jgi:hypothetical protein